MNLNHLDQNHRFGNHPDKFPNLIRTVVEIPKDTYLKYEYHQDGYFFLDRCLLSSMRYPSSYGFIPSTLGEDGDPLDILVYNNHPINMGAVVDVYPIAALKMIDGGIEDLKFVGVPVFHVHADKFKNLSDLDSHWVRQIEHFFLSYKELEGKKVELDGWITDKQIVSDSLRRGWLNYDNIPKTWSGAVMD